MNLAARIATDAFNGAFVPELVAAKRDTRVESHGCLAEEIKRMLRADYVRRQGPLSYWHAVQQSRDFWARYENVNRILCPDDPVYSIVKSGTALSTTADNLTCKAAASGQGRILEVIIGGEATTSAVNRVGVGQLNATLASNGAITPEKFNSRSAAAAGTYGSGNTSALLAGWLLVLAFNAFGGMIDWKAAPGEEMYYVNGEVIGMRSLSGTSTVSSTIIFEEL